MQYRLLLSTVLCLAALSSACAAVATVGIGGEVDAGLSDDERLLLFARALKGTWTGTAILMRPRPAAASAMASRQAARSAHSPIGTMRPLSSATGMKCDGGTRPRPGRCQRSSPSQPRTSPVRRSTCGWQ